MGYRTGVGSGFARTVPFMLVAIAWLLVSQPVFATPATLNFEHFSLEEGLSQSIVKAIVQDRRGFIWFGTEDGLNRYDGYEFKVYRHDPRDTNSLSYRDILALCEDRDGGIWVGTFHGGLTRFDPITHHFERFAADPAQPGSLSNSSIWAISEAPDGSIWVGTEAGLNRLDRNTGTFDVWRSDRTDPHSLSGDFVRALHFDSDGALWVGSLAGLDRLPAEAQIVGRESAGRFDHYTTPGSRLVDVAAIYRDAAGAVWAGTRGDGLFRLDPGSGDLAHYEQDVADPNSLSFNNVSVIRQDPAGQLWIGTLGGGLERYDSETDGFAHSRYDPEDPESLAFDEVWDLLFDRSGCLWVGTWGAGVDKALLEVKPFEHVAFSAGGLSHNTIWAFHRDTKGILWVGSHGGGIDCFDETGARVANYRFDPDDSQSLSNDRVRCIREDRSGKLWFGTHGGGINRFDPETGRFTRFQNDPDDPNSLSGDTIRCIFEDAGGELWIGTYGTGLDRFDPQSETFTHYRSDDDDATTLSNDVVRTIYEDPDELGETLWIGTEGGGLCRLDRRTGLFTRFAHDSEDPRSLSENHVFSILEDDAGALWIGTFAGGLNRFDRTSGTFASYTMEDGLPSNAVYGILRDSRGELWLSTNLGLCRFDPVTQGCRNYDVRDGLQSNEFNGGAYYRAPDGTMYFGGINGFNAFHPEQIVDNAHRPQVVLTDFQLFNKPVGVGETVDGDVLLDRSIMGTRSIELSHRAKVFSFEFAGLHYAAPDQNQYAYKMEGFEPGWNYVNDRRFATYTSLPSGDYAFRVKAANSDGVWNEAGVAVAIKIMPPFWETLWFRLGSVISFVLLAFAAHYLRTLDIRKRNVQLRKEVINRKRAEVSMRRAMEAASEANQVKSEFLANISHEFRTPMNGIIGMTSLTLDGDLEREQRDNLETVLSSADELLEIMNNVFEVSKIEAGRVDLVEREFDPREMLRELRRSHAAAAKGKGLELFLDISTGLPTSLKGDSHCLRQVLKHLLENAIKFSESGSIRIGVKSEAAPDKEAEDDRVRVSFEVEDSGIGIPLKSREIIFESFRQVDGSFTRMHGGTGIGLSLCRKLLRLMGGDVLVESEVGKGSTFRCWLDLTVGSPAGAPAPECTAPENASMKEAAEAAAAGVQPGRTSQSGIRVLLVEDMDLNQKVASAMLKRAGHDVVIAENGRVALDALEREHFDLVLMDIQMPVMNGFEATEKIRASSSDIRHLPIIALTAHTLEGDRERCLNAGMDEYVPKPVRADTLLESIDAVMAAKSVGG